MPATYDSLASTVLSSAQSTVTFSSIPATYTDLILVGSGSLTGTNDTAVTLRFNGDTGSNYGITYLYGNGSTVLTGDEPNLTVADTFYWSTNACTGMTHIQDYATSKWKTCISRSGADNAFVISYTGTWRNSTAINSITIQTDAGQLAAGCIFTLYGILKA